MPRILSTHFFCLHCLATKGPGPTSRKPWHSQKNFVFKNIDQVYSALPGVQDSPERGHLPRSSMSLQVGLFIVPEVHCTMPPFCSSEDLPSPAHDSPTPPLYSPVLQGPPPSGDLPPELVLPRPHPILLLNKQAKTAFSFPAELEIPPKENLIC